MICGTKTWETKGSKHANVHGIEDKKQIKVVLLFATIKFVISFQVIFQGLSLYSLPPLNNRKREYLDSGWNLIVNAKHCLTLNTYKDFVNTILSSYRELQVNLLDLPLNQEIIWFLNYWNVYINMEFRRTPLIPPILGQGNLLTCCHGYKNTRQETYKLE